jgi:hypothetical protein
MPAFNVFNNPINTSTIQHHLLNRYWNGSIVQSPDEGYTAFVLIAVPRCARTRRNLGCEILVSFVAWVRDYWNVQSMSCPAPSQTQLLHRPATSLRLGKAAGCGRRSEGDFVRASGVGFSFSKGYVHS